MLEGKIRVVEECGSTNTEAADRTQYRHGDAVIAISQTAGRGQRGHRWVTAAGENLTFTLVVEPTFLPVARQFLLSEITALAVVDALAHYGIEAQIKWTNDVYVGDRKICGMLIEHSLEGDVLARSLLGIGVNVNQQEFPEWVPNPCSMRTLTGRQYDVREVFDHFYRCFGERYAQLADGGEGAERMQRDYHAAMYRLGRPSRFFLPGEGEVIGTIRGVDPDGRLRVEIDGKVRGFLFREIEFIL